MSEPRSTSPAGWATGLFVGGGALLVALTVLVRLRWDALIDLDGMVTRAARDAVGDSATTLSVARALTHVGDPLVVSLATVALAAGLIAVGSYRPAAYLATVRITVVVATAVLKALIARARPHLLHPLAVAHGYSFPSGHASGSAALWCSVALLVSTRIGRSSAAAVALVVPVLVAATRVLLGVHFLTDVVAGVVLGIEVALGLAMLRFWRLPGG